MATFQNVKGMNDLVPDEIDRWDQVIGTIETVLRHYRYRHIHIPVVEKTALFKRSIGDVTDVVEKEMYTVEDRDGEALSLRPEATAGIVRAAIQHGLLHNQTQRLSYIGPVFRYEKPQKGRARQFHQVDVEAFGYVGPAIDAEIIALTRDIWQRLGLKGAELHLNSLGNATSRARYREALVAYFIEHESVLDQESRDRLHRNPLRLLDSKNPTMADVIANAPDMREFMEDDCKQHFDELCELLSASGIDFTINTRLVRGLDYYNRTVFEWIAPDGLGAQNTICGGGRYDGLVEQLGGKSVPGIGFGLGLERLMLLLEAQTLLPPISAPDYYLALATNPDQSVAAFAVVDQIRSALSQASIEVNFEGASLKSQMKKANKSGAETAIIVGEEEIAKQQITIKPLRGGEQQTLALTEWLSQHHHPSI